MCPVQRVVIAAAVVVGEPLVMVVALVNRGARNLAWPERARRACEPSPSTTTTTVRETSGRSIAPCAPVTVARQLVRTSARLADVENPAGSIVPTRPV
jgi:hypothetical protein